MNKLKVIAGILAVALLAIGGVRIGASASSYPASVVVQMPAAQSLNLNVNGEGRVSGVPFVDGQPSENANIGGLVHNTQETFDAGIAVNGTAVIGADRSVSTTNLYVSGNVSGSLPSILSASMSSSATTTACTFSPDPSGSSRTILAMWVADTGSATSLGSVTWQAATSTISVGLGSSATKGLNTAITRSTAPVITTTSTPQLTGYLQQRSTEYVNFVSGTTTNSGTCYMLAR